MSRAKPTLLLTGLLLSAALSASCSERLTDDEREPDERLLACVAVVPQIQTDAGSNWLLHDGDDFHPYWCTCITEEQLDDELRAWVNERSHEVCVDFVERAGYELEVSDCIARYEEGYWGGPGFPNSPHEEFIYCDEHEPLDRIILDEPAP